MRAWSVLQRRRARHFRWVRSFHYGFMPSGNGVLITNLFVDSVFSKTSDVDRPGVMRSFAVVPLACVELPAFPLQLLLRHRPEWAHYPAAVVAEDKPQGLILWVNERARQHGVLPGLRYAAALSLAAELRASEVAPNEIRKAVKELTQRLMRFTPEVEP